LYYTIKGRDRTENAAVLEQHQTLVFIAFQVFSRVFFVFLHCVQDRPASYIVARASNWHQSQGAASGSNGIPAAPWPFPAQGWVVGWHQDATSIAQREDSATHAVAEPFPAAPFAHARRPTPVPPESRRPREVVVERVIRETGSSGNWSQLTKTNYNEWALLMKLKLQARHLWDVVDT